MSFLKALTFGMLALSQLTQAVPNPTADNSLEARKPYSFVPSPTSGPDPALEKRAMFNVDKITHNGEKDALKQGLKDAVAVAKVVVDKMDDPKHKDKITKWFGPSASYPHVVKQVFENFVGKDSDGTGADVLGAVVVWDVDYGKRAGKPFCSYVSPEGKTGTAYYWPKNKKPGMHFCPKFFDRKDAHDYTAGHCKDIANHINTDTIGRAFRGANVLHEFMHYDKVGEDAVGAQVDDIAYGAYNCLTLQNDKDKLDGRETTENADSYVYFAMHIWLTETCGRDFSYPRGVEDN